MNLKKTLAVLLILQLSGIFLGNVSRSASPEYIPPSKEKDPRRITVATVGIKNILFIDVFEIWGPTWRDTIKSCRNRKLSSDDADKTLQKAWKEALNTVIKDEVFFQEAERNIDMVIKEKAKRIYEAQTGSSRAHEKNPKVVLITNQLKSRHLDTINKYVNNVVEYNIKKSGGQKNFLKILQRQGASYMEWKSKIRHKAVIQYYLGQTIPISRVSQSRPSEVRKYYKNHQKEFTVNGESVFQHIFISFAKNNGEEGAKEKSGQIFEELTSKKISFTEAVKKYSDDKASLPFDGIHPIPVEKETAESLAPERQAWLNEVVEAISEINQKGLGPLLISNSGCHIISIIRKEPDTVEPFSKAQMKIAKMIRNKKREKLINREYLRLREKVNIEILCPKYPAQYSWEAIEKSRYTKSAVPKNQRGPELR